MFVRAPGAFPNRLSILLILWLESGLSLDGSYGSLRIKWCSSSVYLPNSNGLPRCHSGKEPAGQFRRHKRSGFDPWIRKIPWRRKWQPTPVFLPGKSYGQRSLVGYSPGGAHKKWDATEHKHTPTTIYKYFGRADEEKGMGVSALSR